MLTNLFLLFVIAALAFVIWRAHKTHIDAFEYLKAKFWRIFARSKAS